LRLEVPVSVLEVRDLSIRFGGLQALDGVNLDVNEWEIVGIIGPNGAGKTTFFNCVMGVYQPTRGTVHYRGQEVTNMPTFKRCALGLGRTFQNVGLVKSSTVMDNMLTAQHGKVAYSAMGGIFGAPASFVEERRLRENALEIMHFMGLVDYRDARVVRVPAVHRLVLAAVLAAAGCASDSDSADRDGRFTRVREELKLSGESCNVDFYLPETARQAPLVIVAHGFSRSRKNFEGWGQRLAQAGYLVAVPDLPSYTDHKENADAINDLLKLMQRQPPRKVTRPAGDRVALVGHSAGGLASLLAAADNPSVAIWVGLDPVDSGDIGAKAAARRPFPAVVLLAEPSRCNQRENVKDLEKNLRGPFLITRVDGAGHCDPENPSDKWCTVPCGGGYSERRHDIFARYTVLALDAALRDDGRAKARLADARRDRNLKDTRGPMLAEGRSDDRSIGRR
jgi:ABC-type sugar transport system ATPase subunit